MTRHLLEVADLSAAEVAEVMALAKRPVAELGRPLDGQGAALIFEKPSTRTRHSTEIAVFQLGGHPVYARGEEIGMDVRETVEDVVRILQGYHAVIAARVFAHEALTRMTSVATVPIVNLLSDRAHPLQALADALTMEEAFGSLEGRSVAWVGDYNNVARSLGEVCALLGAHVRFACPVDFGADEAELERLTTLGAASVSHGHRPSDAVEGADAVHADTWVSMGHEEDGAARKQAFEEFTVDADLMALADPQAVFMHCLPAYRGIEVTAEVIDGPRSVVFRQGHLRLAAARAALAFLLQSAAL
ncbi:MAG: ornithine carbamoyltransferase [Ilumatobacteraceae bacterium]